MKRPRCSFSLRFNLFLAAIVLLSGLGTSLVLTWQDLRQDFQVSQHRGRILARVIAYNLQYPLQVGDRSSALQLVESFRNLPQLRAVHIVDRRCRPWLTVSFAPTSITTGPCPPRPRIPTLAELIRAAHPLMRLQATVRTAAMEAESALFLTPNTAPEPLAHVELVFDMSGFRDRFLASARDSFLVTTLLLIPVLAFSYARSRRLTRPLERLHAALTRLTEENLGPIEVSAAIPEIRLLEERFNTVRQWLDDYRRNLQRLAFRDSVTELHNRTWLQNHLPGLVQRARLQHRSLAALFLDLDRFKFVNDTLGHAIGDRLLHAVATILREKLRDTDILVRLGGDEFLVLLPGLAPARDQAERQAERAAAKIIAALDHPLTVAGHELRTSFSIGIALVPHDAQDAETLLRFADTAMYAAKEAGRQTVRFFRPEQASAGHRRLTLEAALRRAVERRRLQYFLQPQFPVEGGGVCGAEVLLRWRHQDSWISPAEFIPLLEETGLIVPVGEWLIGEVLALKHRWHRQGLCGSRFRHLAVNVSPVQLWRSDFAERVLAILEEQSQGEDIGLELELTESALVQPSRAVLDTFQRLKAAGVRFAIDDFGTGYSNLAYLKRFPLDAIKIDQSFVRDCTEDPADASLVTAICAMARGLGLAVIGEGVETPAQAEFLRRQGCHVYQGYLFGRPMPAAEFERFLRENAA